MSTTHPSWDIPPAWKPALEAARAGGTLFLIGETDSGKSTLAAVLANEARAAGRHAAVVDADVGQSSIGPPACVGLANVERDCVSLSELTAMAIDFVGACSPVGHLLQAATSTAALVASAREGGADAIIVDTTGLVSGGVARALKSAKIRLVKPDAVIALQQDDEVEHLLASYRSSSRPRVLRLRMSRAVKPRSREERAARRQRSFADYFAGGRSVELSWKDVPVENSAWTNGEPVPGHMRAYAEERVACEVLHAERSADGIFLIVEGRADADGLRTLGESFGGTARAVESASLANLLVGLLGETGETLGLGIVEGIDFRRRRMSLYTPLNDPDRSRGIRLGSLQLARDGTQLGSGGLSAVG